MKSTRTAREAGIFGDLPWLDFRKYDLPGVQVVDPYTLRIRIKGKYPQFKYWLAMTFFSPTPWEVDAFYSQPGMKARNLTLDTWPVGTGPYRLTEYIPNHRMDALVSDEELAKRRQDWKAPEPRVKQGYLVRYARLVSSAATGAILE